MRRVGLGGRYGCEVLGPGDLLRPWEPDTWVTIPFETRWRVMTAARLAMLDLRFAHRAGPYPEVAGALLERVMQRSRSLAISMAIARNPRVQRRLLMLLWHLADRWGRVRPDGVCVPLPLTHELLGDMVVAQRPSITLGLKGLQATGELRRDGKDWVLLGTPPAELTSV